jgi:hypothetical protein
VQSLNKNSSLRDLREQAPHNFPQYLFPDHAIGSPIGELLYRIVRVLFSYAVWQATGSRFSRRFLHISVGEMALFLVWLPKNHELFAQQY